MKFTELPEQMVDCARSLAPTLQPYSSVLHSTHLIAILVIEEQKGGAAHQEPQMNSA